MHFALNMILMGASSLTAHADLSRDILAVQAGDEVIEQRFHTVLRESHLVFVVPIGAAAVPIESFRTQMQYLASVQREYQASFTEIEVPFFGAWQENADIIAERLKVISASV